MKTIIKKFELKRYNSIVCIGAGLTSLTFARRFAEIFSIPIKVYDSRDHIGGNSFSFLHKETGIDVHKYGSHIFHTNNIRIWEFINRFTKFYDYNHKVFVNSGNKLYSFPINLMTLSQVLDRHISPLEAEEYLNMNKIDVGGGEGVGENFESTAISKIGQELYEKFFKGYTKKQWGTDPVLLPAEIFNRLPIRMNFENNYFKDKFQGVPVGTYGDMALQIANHPLIEIKLLEEWNLDQLQEDIFYIYSGAIDKLFDYKLGKLSWRGIKLEFEELPIPDFQGNSVINYSDYDVPFTRIHEFKHFKPNLPSTSTIIAREFPIMPNQKDLEPAYPVRSKDDLITLEKYEEKIARIPNLISVGRLGTYKYIDMHMAIGAALTKFDELCL